MGLLGGSAESNPAVTLEKIDTSAKTLNVIRIIDWEAQVVLYTDTTRDGYTSQPFGQTDIDPDDAPEKVKHYLQEE